MANSTSPKKRTAFTTTVFMKRLMAVSGIVFLLFVLFHMYGNTHYFNGELAYDEYAVFLRTLLSEILHFGGFLWILRVVLMALLLAHIGSAFHLWARNKKARGNDKYAVKKSSADYFASRYAMRTMRWGGVILLFFIVWHILQFTTLSATPGGEYVHGRAYQNMYYGFQLWWVYLIYLIAIVCLALHAWHGVWSALQTLGATRTQVVPYIRVIATLVALVLLVGFMCVPTYILLGLAPEPMPAAEYYPLFCGNIGEAAAAHYEHCAAYVTSAAH